MSKKLLALVAGTVLTFAGAAQATPQVTFDLTLPTATRNTDLGPTHTYTFGGLTIIATGYVKSPLGTTDLYQKYVATDTTEQGLGIYNGGDTTKHFEIQTSEFIQLDVSDLVKKGVTGLTLQINSVQTGESYDVYNSDSAGVLGTAQITAGTSTSPFSFSLKGHNFVNIDAHVGDVLLTQLTAQATPEPSTVLLLTCIGLPVCGYGWYKRRRQEQKSPVAA
jgi:hypothetical protein